MISKLNQHRKHAEEGFSLIELMVSVTILSILAAMSLPFFIKATQSNLTKPIEDDVRSATDRVATYFTRYPSSGEILTATPACDGGAKNINGLLITVSGNNTCISTWGTPTDFYVRGTNSAVKGEFLYSSKDQKYTRTGGFQTTRNNTTTQGDN